MTVGSEGQDSLLFCQSCLPMGTGDLESQGLKELQEWVKLKEAVTDSGPEISQSQAACSGCLIPSTINQSFSSGAALLHALTFPQTMALGG